MPQHCKHELTKENAQKLKKTLIDDENMIYYFNAKHGFKVLVDSFEFGLEALDIICEILPENQKLREDFQR